MALCTLGCKVNQYETQAICELFERAGYRTVPFDMPADVYVINTCSVTSMSERKSRQMIRRARRLRPDAVIVVTGCYAQTAPDKVAQIEGVSLIIGTSDRQSIVALAEKARTEQPIQHVHDIMQTRTFEPLSVSTYTGRVRAYIKAQEGCSQFCSYCIIPYARGPVRSRPLPEILQEAHRLAEAGFCELVLVGIHIASYGRDLADGTDLMEMIRALNEIDGIRRIRLSSIEPMFLDERFLSAVQCADKLCDHFHISLQSGCDETLRRMNRRYTTAAFQKIVTAIRAAYPDAAVTTDIMVGFPQESEAEFSESLSFVDAMDFADAHVFAYSRRRGTRADLMDGQIDDAVKHRRSEEMIALARRHHMQFLQRFVGRSMEVLFEQVWEERPGYYIGKTTNYLDVVCKSETDLTGQFRMVRVTGLDGGVLRGAISSSDCVKIDIGHTK